MCQVEDIGGWWRGYKGSRAKHTYVVCKGEAGGVNIGEMEEKEVGGAGNSKLLRKKNERLRAQINNLK